jgi:hypothetical protein
MIGFGNFICIGRREHPTARFQMYDLVKVNRELRELTASTAGALAEAYCPKAPARWYTQRGRGKELGSYLHFVTATTISGNVEREGGTHHEPEH